ncbi:MAG: nucleoside hydrolase [Planctomycetaceae bacterium]|nr:nucleoside hydrolase [Planctomycetaceae bacterium]
MRAAGLAGVILAVFLFLPSAPATEPVRIVFDTDISGDVDDVLALAMLHTLEDRGHCELLAVTISKVNPLTGPFTSAVNTFYGRAQVPIGVTRKAQIRDSKYLPLVNTRDDGQRRFPATLERNEDAPEAVELLRKVLASQPDHSVVIVQVGLAVNIARLLQSRADQFSPLPGPDLVRQKVRLLSVMAGSFEPINGNTRYHEANVKNDIPSMQQLSQLWPDDVPVVWSGFEIGIAVPYPRESIAQDFEYVEHHIVKEAYLLHSGPAHDRPTWDLTSVLYAVFPDRGYFDVSAPGRVSVADDSYTSFETGSGDRDRYLTVTPLQAARVREALVQLVSQPPAGTL